MLKKRCFLLLLVVAIVTNMLGGLNITSNAATTLTLEELKAKYPHGSRWTGVFDGSSECAGFARMLCYEAYGSEYFINNNGLWTKKTEVSYIDSGLKAGDYVRYKSDYHSVFITGVSGDTVYIADCNSDNNCGVRWTSMAKANLKSGFTHVYSAPYELTTGAHSHSYTQGYEAAHPHKIYMSCSCGDFYYTGSTTTVSSCSSCVSEDYYVDVWASNKGSGYQHYDCPALSSGIVQNSYYIWFKIAGEDSGQLYNGNKTYTSKISIYNPDGSILHEAEYESSSSNWIRVAPKYIGSHRIRIQLSGDWSADYSKTFYVTHDASLSMDKSTISLSMATQKNGYLNVVLNGNLPDDAYVNVNYDSSMILYTQNGSRFDITAKKAGNCSFTISIKLSDGTVLLSRTCNIVISPASYTIQYNLQGGTGGPSSQTKNHGTAITIPNTVPTLFGYTFLGWSTEPGLETINYRPGDSFNDNVNTTLYAVWNNAVQISSSVKGTGFDSNIPFSGGYCYYVFSPSTTCKYYLNSTGEFDAKLYIYDANGTQLATDDDSGSGRNFALEYLFSAGRTYYIKVCMYGNDTGNIDWFFRRIYNISYNANGASNVPPTQSQVYLEHITLSEKIPIKSGYIFLGWATTSDATVAEYLPGESAIFNADKTLYAVWERIALTKIEILSLPTKTVYYLGEPFDRSGLKLKLKYSDNSTETISNGYSYSGFNTSIAGEQTITVAYGGKRATFNVTVKGVTVSAPALIVHITLGESYTLRATTSVSGGVLSWKSLDGNIVEVDDGRLVTVAIGATSVEVSYEYNGFYSYDDFVVLVVAGIGDANADRSIDYGDIQRVYRHVSANDEVSEYAFQGADANDDGVIDYGDIQRIYQHITTNNKLR